MCARSLATKTPGALSIFCPDKKERRNSLDADDACSLFSSSVRISESASMSPCCSFFAFFAFGAPLEQTELSPTTSTITWGSVTEKYVWREKENWGYFKHNFWGILIGLMLKMAKRLSLDSPMFLGSSGKSTFTFWLYANIAIEFVSSVIILGIKSYGLWYWHSTGLHR